MTEQPESPYFFTLVKPPPSDETTRKILREWFRSAQSKWRTPLNICVGCFFLAATAVYLTHDPIPPFAWVAMAGVFIAVFVTFGYIPLLVSAALKANKRLPSYYEEKTYRFLNHSVIFNTGDQKAVEIPYEKFSQARITDDAILLLIGEKLAIWLLREDIPGDIFEQILERLEADGVRLVRV